MPNAIDSPQIETENPVSSSPATTGDTVPPATTGETVPATTGETVPATTVIDTENQLTLKEFNEIKTTEGTIKLNEEIYKEIKITNFYLNLILTSVVVCCCVYFIAKALKKLFYVNIF